MVDSFFGDSFSLVSRGERLEGPFATLDAAVEALLLHVCDPWGYDLEWGAYVAKPLGSLDVPVIVDGQMVDDDYVRSGGSAVQGPNIVEWFDPSNIAHVKAFNSILEGNDWPEGMLPDYMQVGARIYMAYFPVDWEQQIKNKINDGSSDLFQWSNDEYQAQQILDNFWEEFDAEDYISSNPHASSEAYISSENSSVSNQIVFDTGRCKRDTRVVCQQEGLSMGKFAKKLENPGLWWSATGAKTIAVGAMTIATGSSATGAMGSIRLTPPTKSTEDAEDWELIKEDVLAAHHEDEFKPKFRSGSAKALRRRRWKFRFEMVLAVIIIAFIAFISHVLALSESLATSVVQSGDELVMTVEVKRTLSGDSSYQAYRQINSFGEPEWFLYPSGKAASNTEDLEGMYQSYLLEQEALNLLKGRNKK